MDWVKMTGVSQRMRKAVEDRRHELQLTVGELVERGGDDEAQHVGEDVAQGDGGQAEAQQAGVENCCESAIHGPGRRFGADTRN